MSSTEPNDFFRERRSFTEIKKEILGKYFDTWSDIRLAPSKDEAHVSMVYIDLHAGDGRETEESSILPIDTKGCIYKSIVKKPLLNEALQTFYYNKDRTAVDQVNENMEVLPYYQDLLHPPLPLTTSENKTRMGELIEVGCPSLLFLDPFRSGYGQQMLLQAVNTWRSDLFMQLHPDTISRAVAGKKVSQPLVGLFGERLQAISNYCRKEKDNHKRQEFILGHLLGALQEKGHLTLLFKVNQPEVEQPYHYLLFSSPDPHAYRIFKETVLPYSTYHKDGIPLYIANEFLQPQFSLFEQRPVYTLPNLVERLTNQAAQYKYKSIEKIYEMDNCGTSYTRENYLAAYEQLRKEGKIELLNAKTMQTIRQPTPASVVKYRL